MLLDDEHFGPSSQDLVEQAWTEVRELGRRELDF
jgi:hypothetical protein